jgi:hypothetical protein
MILAAIGHREGFQFSWRAEARSGRRQRDRSQPHTRWVNVMSVSSMCI